MIESAVHFESRLFIAREQAQSMLTLSVHSSLGGPHRGMSDDHCDRVAVTQQGTSVVTEESACSMCSLVLN